MTNMRMLAIITLLLLVSCDDTSHEFSLEAASGIWVPYEIKNVDGSLVTTELLGYDIFGAYSESVHLKADGTFVPVRWISKSEYYLNQEDSGSVAYSSVDKVLTFSSSVWVFSFTLSRYDRKTLWLKSKEGVEFKFKKTK